MDDAAAQEAMRRGASSRIAGHFEVLESRIPESGWLGGEHFSIADAYLLPFYRWGWRIGFTMADYPCIDAWARRASELAAVRRVVAREGIALFECEKVIA